MTIILLNTTKRNEIRKQLRNKYIKLFGYDKKIVIDNQVDRFLNNKKSKPLPNELIKLDLILKKEILSISSKHRKIIKHKDNKELDSCHYDLKRKQVKSKNYNKNLLNYTDQQWHEICKEQDNEHYENQNYLKLIKKEKQLNFKKQLDIQTGKIILKNKSTSIKKTKKFKKYEEKDIKQQLKEVRREQNKIFNASKQIIKESKEKRDLDNYNRNLSNSKYKTIILNNNIINKNKIIKDLKYDDMIEVTKVPLKCSKPVKYYESSKIKKEIKFSNTFKNKINTGKI